MTREEAIKILKDMPRTPDQERALMAIVGAEWVDSEDKDVQMCNALWNLLKILYAQDYTITDVGCAAGEFREWLESIKKRFELQKEQKPAEWSEEEKLHLYNAIEAVKCVYDVSEGTGGYKCVEFLKSLRPQSRWKPTEEQMNALEFAKDAYERSDIRDALHDLFFDLKKL